MTNVVQLKSDDENDRLAFIEAFNTVAARYQYLQSETTKPGLKVRTSQTTTMTS